MSEKEVNEIRPIAQATEGSDDKFSNLVSQALAELANRDTVAGAAASALGNAISKATEMMYCCHFTEPERNEHEEKHGSRMDQFMCLHREEHREESASTPEQHEFKCTSKIENLDKTPKFDCAHLINPPGFHKLPKEMFACTHRIEPISEAMPPRMFACAFKLPSIEEQILPPKMFACTHRIEPDDYIKPSEIHGGENWLKPGRVIPKDLFQCAHRENNNV